jgi:hypothetical protein
MILISGPVIAKLCLHTRKWAHEHLRRGSFGPVTEHNGVLYAPLPNVERHAGETFSETRLALAVDGKPDRVLTIIVQTQEAA